MYRHSTAMFLLLCMLTTVSQAAVANTIDRIVAVVNGEVILWSDLQEKVQQAAAGSADLNMSDPTVKGKVERAVLDQMIHESLARAEVKRLKISVSEHEVNETINTIKKENGFTDDQLQYVVQQQGQTMAQFREDIRRQLERARLVDRVFKSKTVITEDQVEAYLKTEPRAAASSMEKYRLAVIFLPFASGSQNPIGGERGNADMVVERLKKGEDFAMLARQYSKGPAADEGGDIGFIAAEELAPEIASAIGGLGPGEVSDVVKGAGGYYLIKVLDVKKDQVRLSDAEAREKVKRELFQQEVARKFENWMKDLQAKAFVDIRL